jgi:hypothetical protein
MVERYHEVFRGNSVENVQAVLLPITKLACIGPGMRIRRALRSPEVTCHGEDRWHGLIG